MSSIKREESVASRTTRRILAELDEEQKSEIVQDIADSLLFELKQNDTLAKRIGRAVIDQVPLVSQSPVMKTSTTMAVDTWLRNNSEEVIEDVGGIIVEEIVGSHSEMVVDDSITAVVEEVGKTNDG